MYRDESAPYFRQPLKCMHKSEKILKKHKSETSNKITRNYAHYKLTTRSKKTIESTIAFDRKTIETPIFTATDIYTPFVEVIDHFAYHA